MSLPYFVTVHTMFSTVHLQCNFGEPLCPFIFFNFFLFSVFRLYFFFLLIIYKNPHIYCYTNTINFTIFSQLLRCQFLISQNKIIKYETVTNYNKNKYFVKMLWHLLGECVKTTVLLVCSICIFFFNHRFVLFFLIYNSANVHTVFLRYTSTVPFC